MILNVKLPPIDAYDSPEAAIMASKAKNAEFSWFDPEEVQGEMVEATSWGYGWFALRLSNARRIVVTPGETILQAKLDTGLLPPTEPFAKQVEIRSEGVNGPYSYTWNVEAEAKTMIGQRIHFVTFHPRRLILTFARDYCAWFWLMIDLDRQRFIVDWRCSEE